MGEKLRVQWACANVLTVFLHTNRFREDLPQYHPTLNMALPVATSDGVELPRYALAALKALYKPGYLYKKARVLVTGIVPDDQV